MPKTTAKDINKTKTLFQIGADDNTELRVLRKYNENKKMIASNYMVYSYAALPVLIDKMKRLESFFSEENKHIARYSVEANGSMWFALEGSPGSRIDYIHYINLDEKREQAPAHSDMTPTPNSGVVSTGTIVFSEDYKINKITNSSGHFRPYATRLVWPLQALLSLNADFTDDVELIFYWKIEGKALKHKTVSLPKNELHTLLPAEMHVISDPSYKIGVYSNGKWEQFGPADVPQFKAIHQSPSLFFGSIFRPSPSSAFRPPKPAADVDIFPTPSSSYNISACASPSAKRAAFDVQERPTSRPIEIQENDSSLLTLSSSEQVNASDVVSIYPSTPPASPPPNRISLVDEPFSDSDSDSDCSNDIGRKRAFVNTEARLFSL